MRALRELFGRDRVRGQGEVSRIQIKATEESKDEIRREIIVGTITHTSHRMDLI